ncbi:Na+/H+ antiporter subunit E [Nitrosomonas aestuarii]|uniref:Multisubunit potassium/proton antiporter, PhaE subunit n=1 Tax=Nitrosomonas aestuarii TaxID=52441 RepID=A0A1I3XBK3_9PROT|nr:Na+/H+ antiporter subunit E [Nitrosomonas aestuarii]PTN12814.1 multisubunit potassium/proton antiporter PhaE subunit [Nitrosomonas aestuarii]SFK16900.1 multisubunit potassium/proton antiporter, PhaE subunit [Nitrosomonas aestuarii]
MTRLLPHPVLTPVLAVIWLLLNNSIEPGQILLGLALSWAIPVLTIRFWPEAVSIQKPFALVRYTIILFYDIIMANFTVARLILGNPDKLKPSFVKLPLDLTSDLAISLLANSITLTPGTLSAQLSDDHSYLLVHALNETDPETLVANIKQRYEKPLKEIFESC